MSRSGIPGWSSASCFLRAAQTPALGTQSGTDAPHPHLTPPGISTPRAWLSGILAVCPDEDSKASQVGSQREQSKVKHYLMLIPPLSPPHPSAMSVDTVPRTPRQVLLEAPGHPSFCVHHTVHHTLGPQQCASVGHGGTPAHLHAHWGGVPAKE